MSARGEDEDARQVPQVTRAEGRVAVCVSGAGSNLRALQRAAAGGRLGGRIQVVVADRPCAALEFAAGQGIVTALVPPAEFADRGAWDRALFGALRAAQPDVVVLAGFMRWVGLPTLDAFRGRILNVHPSLLPSFPGARAVEDALAAAVKVTGVTVHLVDETLDRGPIVAQEAVPIQPTDDRHSLTERLHAVEHRLLPRCVALALAGALRTDGRQVRVDADLAGTLPRTRRALLSVSDKRGLVELGSGLVESGWELVSTGGTARALRQAGLPVTDVASVTAFPEMLEGRVKTLHPKIAAGLLADLRDPDHRAQLTAQAIEPFELAAVNLYPFASAAARAGITLDELVEEIDIGGPTLVRAAAKNHASVAVLTDPGQYAGAMAELNEAGALFEATRRELALAAFRHTAAYDVHIAETLARHLDGGNDESPFPALRRLELSLVEQLRYGENPHQAAALYRSPGMPATAGPFADGVELLQGKPLSYNNILDAAAAAGLARELRGPACVIVKHTNPCGAAEAANALRAWEAALAADPVSAFGGVVAVTRSVDAALAERLTAMFLEVVVVPRVEDAARDVLRRKPQLRVVLDRGLGVPPTRSIEYRSAGGGLLIQESDAFDDDPESWRHVTATVPTVEQRQALVLAWRVARHVKSNAIVLVRGGAVVGVGAGQMSRVDSARLAVAGAGERARGAVCASDAFYPFPDGVEVCTAAGVEAFVQPGGSQRDGEVIAAADAAGAAMLFTGRRHFRH